MLSRTFFDRPVLQVAPDLLGRVLLHESPEGTVAVRLTEVEAYDGENDPGSHAYRGRTARNAVMFGPAGHLYVYLSYGIHICANLVCGPDGRASAVLMRGGEVVAGGKLAAERRPTARRPTELARGPGRLGSVLGLDLALWGVDTCDPESPVRVLAGLDELPPELPLTASALAAGPVAADRPEVRSGPRTGIGGDGAAHPWRFWIDGERSVSPYRAHAVRSHRPRYDEPDEPPRPGNGDESDRD